jgi:hypothetical protein
MAFDAERGLSAADKLEMLADALESVPEEKFDVSTWWSQGQGCGCIAGWGIKKLGARFELELVANQVGNYFPIKVGSNRHYDSVARAQSWSALADAFGITLDEARAIFCNIDFPLEVAAIYGTTKPTRAEAQAGLRRYAQELRVKAGVAVIA